MAVAVIASLLVGFLAGLLSFKKKSTWCTGCGAVKSCPQCSYRSVSSVGERV